MRDAWDEQTREPWVEMTERLTGDARENQPTCLVSRGELVQDSRAGRLITTAGGCWYRCRVVQGGGRLGRVEGRRTKRVDGREGSPDWNFREASVFPVGFLTRTVKHHDPRPRKCRTYKWGGHGRRHNARNVSAKVSLVVGSGTCQSVLDG